MNEGKTAEELKTEYERIKKLARQDLIDLNSGRDPVYVGARFLGWIVAVWLGGIALILGLGYLLR